jgi:hypothetical protein
MDMADNGTEAIGQRVEYTGISKVYLNLDLRENFINSFEFSTFYAAFIAYYDITDRVRLRADGRANFTKDFDLKDWRARARARYKVGGAAIEGYFILDGSGKDFGDKVVPSVGVTFNFDW